MVQEFHVLRCFSCQTFQVHQVKKSKKWNCKMCGEKQSLVKVYGRGSGADCRRHVQKLNSLRGELHEAEHARFSWEPEDEEEELKEEGDEALTCENQQGAAGAVSRWSKYLSGAGGGAGPEEGEDEAAEEEENVSMERSAYHGSRRGCARKAGKRKRSWRFSPLSGESARAERSRVDQSAVEDPWHRAKQSTQPEGTHDSHSSSWAASKSSHDAPGTSRPPPAADAPPPLGASSRGEPESRSSKWSRFLSLRREDDEEDEEPQRDTYTGTSRGRAGSEKPLGFPSVSMGRFEEHGRFQEEVRLTNRVFAGVSEKSPESSLKFSPGYQCIQKMANHRDGLGHLHSRLPASAAPACPQNLSISKPHPSLHSLFQTDEDFDDSF
ncbi:MRN complex-interacting protein [Anguilla rostrata]|uniref:MRN complex-interacting protein n=1 Tax=Anguilla rostrata TaxID=7938 RepID=UPI0030CBF5B3